MCTKYCEGPEAEKNIEVTMKLSSLRPLVTLMGRISVVQMKKIRR
jgi:hypothetical protein